MEIPLWSKMHALPRAMPAPKVDHPLTPSPSLPPDPLAFTEACVSKAVMSSAVGSVMGAGLGFFIGSYQNLSPPITLPGVPEPPQVPVRYQLRESWWSTARKARRWGRNMMVVGGMLSGVECVVEKYRAKHDILNNVVGGAVTGAVLAVRQGPWGMVFGSAGFALFSVVTEKLMGPH